jgi:hypothetical protein
MKRLSANKMLDKCISLFTVENENTNYEMPSALQCEPANKKIVPQRRFKSTKKKSSTSYSLMNKPSSDEVTTITQSLQFPNEEHTYSNFDHNYC